MCQCVLRPPHGQWKQPSIHAPPVSYFIVPLLPHWPYDVMTPVTWCYDVIPYLAIQIKNKAVKLPQNHIFQPGGLDLWPVSFIIKVAWDIVHLHPVPNIYVRTSSSSAMRALTDRRTDRTNSITCTSIADMESLFEETLLYRLTQQRCATKDKSLFSWVHDVVALSCDARFCDMLEICFGDHHGCLNTDTW